MTTYYSALNKPLPEALNRVKEAASGFEVNSDCIDFVVYGGNNKAPQVRRVIREIEQAGYKSLIRISPRYAGLRHCADGRSRQFGIVAAYK